MYRPVRLVCRQSVLLTTIGVLTAWPLAAQTPAQPAQAKPPASTQKPAPRPSTAKPAPAPAKPAAPAAPAAAAKPPAPPPPEDLHFKTVYTNGDQKTETVTYIKGQRERFEFQDMVLLKQHDQKRTIQIMRSANTYMVAPEGAPPQMPAVPGVPQAIPKPPGVIMMTTTIVDTGERRMSFNQPARHVKMVIDKQPMAGACDTSRMRIETDAWYIDPPKTVAAQSAPDQPAPVPGACADQIQATSNGDAKAVGFPIEYKTTMTGDDGKPIMSTMQITEFEATTLDAALFDVPPGMNAVLNVRDLGKAMSDANEVKLAATDAAPPPAPAPKTPGVIRIGVPEFTNKTPQMVDGRALRARLIQDLTESKFEAMPMAAGAAADLQKHAAEQGYDYLLLAEVSELKVSKPGGLGGLMKAAGGVAGARGGAAGVAAGAAAGAASAPKENTESSLSVKLLSADGKQKLATTTKGKDGSGFTLQSGLGLAKFAGTMYVGMFAGPQLLMRMNAMGISHLSGMGLIGDPNLLRYQMGSMSMMGEHRGVDTTANAAGYLIQQSMAMNQTGGFVGIPGQGPSYDESLGEAVQNAAKAVTKALQK